MRTLVACALVLALATTARAATISSPVIFGAYTQTTAQCVVFNGGTSPLSVTVKILNEGGGVVRSTTCDGPLPAGEFCSDASSISSGVGYACSATAGSTANLRGALTIEETNGTDQRPIRSAALH